MRIANIAALALLTFFADAIHLEKSKADGTEKDDSAGKKNESTDGSEMEWTEDTEQEKKELAAYLLEREKAKKEH